MKKHYASNQRLLDRVCYLSKPQKITNLFGKEMLVKSTFAYNPDSKSSPETAKNWVGTHSWDEATRRYVVQQGEEPVERHNEPFCVSIVDLDVRSQGGRAYKVIDSENRLFDLREDQMLEVLKYKGIHPGGEIPGTFVWGILGSQMRLVLVGGDLHKEMTLQAQALKQAKAKVLSGDAPIASKLKFGHIYEKADKTLHLFLGRVKAPTNEKPLFAFVKMPDRPDVTDDDVLYASDDSTWKEQLMKMKVIAQNWENLTWTQRCNWDWIESNKYMEDMYKNTCHSRYSYANMENIFLMSSPKLINDVGEDIELATKLRENVGSKHKYVSGNDVDMAETRFVTTTGSSRQWDFEYNPMSGYTKTWYSLGYEERQKRAKEHQEKVQIEYDLCRSQFQKELVWL